MNRNLRLGTLTTALLLAAAAMYIEPRPAHAICVCDTENGPWVTDCWGKGSDCNAAVANLPTACRSLANQICYNDLGYDGGSCQQTVVQNTPYYCWYDAASGMYVVDGVVTFKCKTCTDIDPIDPRP
ncbi:MAG TPA: hypothetical protein VF789_02930 [Thermoanaerobaculia bacterium]